MTYLVCRWKDNSGYFVTTRTSRETMLSVLKGLGQEIESSVLKSFTNYTLAINYQRELEKVDKNLDSLLTNKNNPL